MAAETGAGDGNRLLARIVAAAALARNKCAGVPGMAGPSQAGACSSGAGAGPWKPAPHQGCGMALKGSPAGQLTRQAAPGDPGLSQKVAPAPGVLVGSATGGKRAFPASDRCGHSGKKTPARGRGPEPQSSGRGVIALRKQRCCLRSSTAGGRGPFCPPGYVRRSEDRFCEPQCRRLRDHHLPCCPDPSR